MGIRQKFELDLKVETNPIGLGLENLTSRGLELPKHYGEQTLDLL
jgi:hypothetical protein